MFQIVLHPAVFLEDVLEVSSRKRLITVTIIITALITIALLSIVKLRYRIYNIIIRLLDFTTFDSFCACKSVYLHVLAAYIPVPSPAFYIFLPVI